ncbi:MAG TPA: leucine-rich repeat domain-containing protein, partial [Clostridia bacterium]
MTDGLIIKDGILEKCTLRDVLVEVPDNVKIIGEGAFKGCTSIEQIILPETITDIMDDAFKGCKKLKKLNFPSNLTNIGEYAFHRCHSLQNAVLPSSVKKLGKCVFLYCDSLEYASIPGVTHLGWQVFLNDINLKEIKISSDLELSCICDVFTGCGKISKISFSDGTAFHIESLIEVISSQHSDVHPLVKAIAIDIYRMMEICDGKLVKFLTNLKYVEVPHGITSISKSCFFDRKGIITIKLPETLTDIGSKAFRNCINLESVEFTSDSVNISQDAFKNCTTLKYITLPDGNTYELKGLPDTTDDRIPPIVRTIHSQVLNNFFISGTTLVQYRGSEERVVVPDGIAVIVEKAFAGNGVVGKVILPDSVQEIREEAFADCLAMQTIDIKEGLNYLGKSAFENCVKLIRAELPESLTKIEKSAFNRCRKLNEVLFGSNVAEIGDLAFYACNSLKNIHLPDGLKSIGDMAFYKCFSLDEITLPKSLSSLGSNVFTASGLKSAAINCNLNECGTDVFSQCNKLKKLSFDEGVKSIGNKFAFSCPSLKYVNLPSSIEYIGKNAFHDSIYIKEMVQNAVANKIFLDGSNLAGNVVIPDGITAIAGGAFYSNTKITSITLPESVVRI